ncbi:DUF6233 domain-containing protein [Streptomyces sp. KL116D]|uniref:DUF6233 domain-containing protein n=1 Tax=Streptomyces sp. KL116D TaxID=3045152 RepID=UPI00355826CF
MQVAGCRWTRDTLIIEHVSESSSLEQRISQHHTVQAWLRYQLGAAERAVKALKRSEPARAAQHRTMVAYLRYQLDVEERTISELDQQRARLAEPVRFKIEPKSSARQPHLHRADCWLIADGPLIIDADQARIALRDDFIGLQICDACDPLGVLRDDGAERPAP